jgi:hypothetical protein
VGAPGGIFVIRARTALAIACAVALCSLIATDAFHAVRAAGATEAFVFPFQDKTRAVPQSQWTQDEGVDISADGVTCSNEPVLVAVSSGTVQVVDSTTVPDYQNFGPWVEELTPDPGTLFAGRVIYYGHAKDPIVTSGHVIAGQPLTHVGCGLVGDSSAPHVEIGVFQAGETNPLRFPPFQTTSQEMFDQLVASYNATPPPSPPPPPPPPTAALVEYGTQLQTFSRAADGSVVQESWDPSAGDWQTANLGGVIQGSPTAVVYGSQLHVFARGADNQLYHDFYDPGAGAFSGWTPLGGVVASDPVADVTNNQIRVFVLGSDNAIYEYFSDPLHPGRFTGFTGFVWLGGASGVP